ncbi:MAG: bifunctional riboflavin kinase/FAD synthetase [Bauldia sp.]
MPRPPLILSPIDPPDPRLRRAVVAIGNFDGVHRGHQHVLRRARALAVRLDAPSAALTFEPHPRTFFRPAEPVFRITPQAAKARLLAALGLSGMIVLPFDRRWASLLAADFVRHLGDGIGVGGLLVGADFRFGAGRQGSVEDLRAAGERYGFAVEIVDKIGDAERAFSSGRVREALAAGDIAAANAVLGYRWFVAGTVIHGDARGRELGFPTANIDPGPDFRLRDGIYAVEVRRADGETFAGVANYGRRPTFGGGAPLLEAHLFRFGGDLYGETLTVSFIGWIRAEERFPSAAALVARMNEDADRARDLIAAARGGLTELDRDLAAIG